MRRLMTAIPKDSVICQKKSERTQFLFVSHNKNHGNGAATHRGNQQESGVSRIVEVDIEAAMQSIMRRWHE